jgi:Ca2+:H+ antiporter
MISRIIRIQRSREEHGEEDEEQRPRRYYTFTSQLKATLFTSWWNVLLVVVIAGFVVKYCDLSPVATFCVNFIAIFPLGNLLSLVTEELTIRGGDHKGLIVIVTFGSVISLVIWGRNSDKR